MTDVPPTAQPKKKTRKGRRRARQKHEEFVHYELHVNEWDYYYGIRVSDPKSSFDKGPYSELATLKFRGALMSPEDTRYPEGLLTLSARTDMMNERYQSPLDAVGLLQAYENTLSAYIPVPAERFAELTAVASSGRVRFVSILGTRLRYRSGSIHNISVSTEFEEEEEEHLLVI